jgi:hypothetical protein
LAVALVVAIAPLAIRAQEEEKPAEDKDAAATRRLIAKAEEEYRTFFKRPETTYEHWVAIRFETDVGKFDLAALHLKLLLEKKPAEEVDAELAKIEAVEGMSRFLRLTTIKQWSDHPPFQKEAVKNVEILLDRLSAAIEKNLSDPARFKKFIPRLDAPSEEERLFAFTQINRSKARAGSYLIDALRDNFGKPLYGQVVDAMVGFDPESVPGWIEALKAVDRQDAQNAELRLTLLDVIDRRGEKSAIPYLWHLAESRMYPGTVNAKAKLVLGRLMRMDPERLPPSKIPLTELAERYYQHKVPFGAAKGIEIWPWDGASIATKPVLLTPRQAEEFYGLRRAREALELDPRYLPAQIVFLSLTLDRAYGAALDESLLKPMPPRLQELVGSIDAELLRRVLDRALDDGNVPVILASTQALGDRGDVRAARTSSTGAPLGIVRALYFPDRRVQYVAARALLGIPGQHVPVASARVVEIMGRLLAASPFPKALVAYAPADQSGEYRKGVKEAGFEAVLVRNIKEAFAKARESSDYDVIILHDSAGKELAFALAQVRADADLGRTPILVLAAKDNQLAVEKLAARYPHVRVVADTLVMMGDELKNVAEAALAATTSAKLSADERKAFKKSALDALWRMARGETPGYDVRPALDAVVATLDDPELGLGAVEILSRTPGNLPQHRLASLATDPAQGKMRFPAAIELNRHIQKHGLLLNQAQINAVKQAYQEAKEPELKAMLAMVIGAMGPSAQLTGSRLVDFRPDAPAPPPEKEEKKDEKKEK